MLSAFSKIWGWLLEDAMFRAWSVEDAFPIIGAVSAREERAERECMLRASRNVESERFSVHVCMLVTRSRVPYGQKPSWPSC